MNCLFVVEGWPATEGDMSRIWRRFRIVVAAVLAFAVGSLPACGTMGGGGMKYIVEPPYETLAT